MRGREFTEAVPRRRLRVTSRLAPVASAVACAAAALAVATGCGTAQPAQQTSGPTVVRHDSRLSPTGGISGSGCQGTGYTPGQIQVAYDMAPLYRQGYDGTGTTIAIVDSFGSPTIKSDLHHFDVACGLRDAPSLRVITPAGKPPKFDPGNTEMTDWAGETSLDVEWAHAMAPGAKILLVETPVSETEGVHGFPQIVTAENYVIRHHMANVISLSLSATEQTFPSRQSILGLRSAFVNARRAGITVVAASGDYGPTSDTLDMKGVYRHRVNSWPSSDPLVTSVGGTQLDLNAQGQRNTPDQVWNSGYAAGGGGLSAVFARPSYQNSVAGVTGPWRGTPDVSLTASPDAAVPVWQTYGGAGGWWEPTGGTSGATPTFAGIVAIADQIAGKGLGLINPSLYVLARQPQGGIIDITQGNNSSSGVHGYRATKGYDLASGLGTVDGNLLARGLARMGPDLGR